MTGMTGNPKSKKKSVHVCKLTSGMIQYVGYFSCNIFFIFRRLATACVMLLLINNTFRFHYPWKN